MASIRKRIHALSTAIDTLGNGGPVWYPDPEIIEEVEAIVAAELFCLKIAGQFCL